MTLTLLFSASLEAVEAEDIYKPLITKINAVSSGAAGAVYGLDSRWRAIVGGDEDTYGPSTFCMAREYGKGRVVVIGHDGILNESAWGSFDNAQFLKNILDWLKNTNTARIRYATGHGELVAQPQVAQLIADPDLTISGLPDQITSAELRRTGVLIVGNASKHFTEQEVEVVRRFVEKGGGLLLAGLGWSWTAYNPSLSIDDYPMQRLAAPFGARWLKTTIKDPSDEKNAFPIFRTFYPSLNSPTTAADMATINDAHRSLAADLPNQLETNAALRVKVIGAHANLAAINSEFLPVHPLRAEISDFYTRLVEEWPNFYARNASQDSANHPTATWLRERAWRTLRDSLELTGIRKKSLAELVRLCSRQRDIFIDFDLIVMDNCRLNPEQLDFLYRLIALVPSELHNLAAVSVVEFLGTPPSPIILEGLGGQVNTFGVAIDKDQENQFPLDISAGNVPIFCSALVHEVNHVVDAVTIGWETNSPLAARRKQLIEDAGANDQNYLRGMASFFVAHPQEFFASISNQWFADTKKTLELAKLRADRGTMDPINQALFFADVYSRGQDFTYAYRIDPIGNIERKTLPLVRDKEGRIEGLWIESQLYSFVLDDRGNVTKIKCSK